MLLCECKERKKWNKKKKKNGMSFKSSVRVSGPISEVTTHVFMLKGLELWLIKDQVIFESKEWDHNVIYCECLVVEWLQWIKGSRNIPKISPSHSDFMAYTKYIWKYIVLINWDWLITNIIIIIFWYDVKLCLFLRIQWRLPPIFKAIKDV